MPDTPGGPATASGPETLPVRQAGSTAAREVLDPGPRIPLAVRAGVVAAIAAVAFSSLAYFYSHHVTNVYGDAIAHVEGARRIFDSRTPGYQTIGTVWLPLPHLLAAPLAVNDFLWKSGLAGGLVSTAATLATAWLIFCLSLEMSQSLGAGLVGLAGYLLCPNMAYIATTALTEPLAILWAVVAVYALFHYQTAGRTRDLVSAGGAAFLGALTRYDGWYLLPFATVFVFLARSGSWRRRLGRAAVFGALAGLAPALWLAHNAYRFGSALEFFNGPFSAKGIYAHELATTAYRYPTDGSLLLSAVYFLEDLRLVAGVWSMELAALGLVAWLADRAARGRRSAALLLLVPLPFYIHSMAYAAVPIFVPTLTPFGYYNLRYGLEMLPALAVFTSFLVARGLAPNLRRYATGILLVALSVQAALLSARGLIRLPTVRESIANTPCRSIGQRAVIDFLRTRYDGGSVLAAAGKWPCVMPEVGISFRNNLTEMDRDEWTKLRSEPEKLAEWIIRGQGDPVDELMRAHPEAFRGYDLLMRVDVKPEGSVSVYRRHRP